VALRLSAWPGTIMAGGVVPEPLTHERAEKLAEVLPDLIAAASILDELVGEWLDPGNGPASVIDMDRAVLVRIYEAATADVERMLPRLAEALR
jgi:hypothetical protein